MIAAPKQEAAAMRLAEMELAKRVMDIEEALRELPITREAEAHKLVTRWAKILAERAAPSLDKGRAPHNFRPGSTAKVKSDLAEIVREAELIASKIEAGGQWKKAAAVLSATITGASVDTFAALDRAIGAVSAVDCGRERFNLGYFRFNLPDDLRSGLVSAATIRAVARLARVALSLDPVGTKTGSPSNDHAKAVAAGAAGAFIRLTGKRPPISNSSPSIGQVAATYLTARLFEVLAVQGGPDPAFYVAEAFETYYPLLGKKSGA